MHNRRFILFGLGAALTGCKRSNADAGYAVNALSIDAPPARIEAATAVDAAQPIHVQLAQAAEARTYVDVVYDGAYVAIDYPGGEIADDRGVCADLVVRAYRAVGVDLQVALHEDMSAHFSDYPNIWGLRRPDSNIDHRRVLNLEAYFTRRGDALGEELDEGAIQPGDLVAWRVDDRLPHIGLATTLTDRGGRRLFAHNIGAGPELAACYDAWTRKGVYRHRPWLDQG